MIGQKWYYVGLSRPAQPMASEVHSVQGATIIGETPRKWILREDSEWRDLPPGESFDDWSIPKTGSSQRSGRSMTQRKMCPRLFFATKEAAQAEIVRLQEWQWAEGNAYRISREVALCRDAEVLRRVAELVGWKENAS